MIPCKLILQNLPRALLVKFLHKSAKINLVSERRGGERSTDGTRLDDKVDTESSCRWRIVRYSFCLKGITCKAVQSVLMCIFIKKHQL